MSIEIWQLVLIILFNNICFFVFGVLRERCIWKKTLMDDIDRMIEELKFGKKEVDP